MTLCCTHCTPLDFHGLMTSIYLQVRSGARVDAIAAPYFGLTGAPHFNLASSYAHAAMKVASFDAPHYPWQYDSSCGGGATNYRACINNDSFGMHLENRAAFRRRLMFDTGTATPQVVQKPSEYLIY
jgi:hypothetical protein